MHQPLLPFNSRERSALPSSKARDASVQPMGVAQGTTTNPDLAASSESTSGQQLCPRCGMAGDGEVCSRCGFRRCPCCGDC
jgi:hypothetical protein